MAEEKEINPLMKQVLELGPPIVFFLIYFRIKDNEYEMWNTTYSGLVVATLIFIPIILLAIAAGFIIAVGAYNIAGPLADVVEKWGSWAVGLIILAIGRTR